MDYSVINKSNITYLKNMLLDPNGKIRVLPYIYLRDVPQNHLSQFCTEEGFYCVPTVELIEFLMNEIGEEKNNTIEIASGNGIIGRSLGIKAVDNYMQLKPEIRAVYEASKQSIVPYGEEVERLDAGEAIRKYKPSTVVAAWYTHKYNQKEHWRGGNQYAFDEKKILEKVNKYIHIGNEKVHGNKPILKLDHKIVREPWILSRSMSKELNYICIWCK